MRKVEEAFQTILDLAMARVSDLDRAGGLELTVQDYRNVKHDLLEIARLAKEAMSQPIVYCKRCPFAMHLHPTPPEAGSCPGYT